MTRTGTQELWQTSATGLDIASVMPADPLILTLALDDDTQTFFEARRRAYFPPSRNKVPAHLTLFHALPGEKLAQIEDALADLAAITQPVPLLVSGLRFMGRGVAYVVEGAELDVLRGTIAAQFADDLTPQDRQRFKAHVTVQNKVKPERAKELHELLEGLFEPFEATGTGLKLWHYRGGPWEAAGEFLF